MSNGANKHYEEETRRVREVASKVMSDLNVDDEGPESK